MKKFFIGIDVSKEKLDFCLIQGEQIMTEFVIENNCSTIKTIARTNFGISYSNSNNCFLCYAISG